jgi:hypothetical protein
VSQYSSRTFTREEDRLVSIKGLAAEVKKARKDQGYFLWTWGEGYYSLYSYSYFPQHLFFSFIILFISIKLIQNYKLFSSK